MPMRTKSLRSAVFHQAVRCFLYAATGLLVAVSNVCATVNISFSSSAATLQDEFIQNTTSQYTGTLTKSPYFANTYSFTITGKNSGYQPPAVSSPIATATAVDALLAYGVGNGMDYERYANIQQIWGLQAEEVLAGTCGGVPVTILTSTQAISGACMQAYNLATSTISLRWNYIFDPHGVRVYP